MVVEKKQSVIFEKAGSSTDSALAAVFVPVGYDEYVSAAYSAMLGQIVQPWFTISYEPKSNWDTLFRLSDERWPSVGNGIPATEQR